MVWSRDDAAGEAGDCRQLGAAPSGHQGAQRVERVGLVQRLAISRGDWSAAAAAGSAQALAASAGFAASGLPGWVLPTGNGSAAAGAQNQYLSIWNQVGSSSAGLSSQFDGVQFSPYRSGTEYALDPGSAWFFIGFQSFGDKAQTLYAVAVLPGDVALIPEPQTLALALLALGATMVVRRRRPV